MPASSLCCPLSQEESNTPEKKRKIRRKPEGTKTTTEAEREVAADCSLLGNSSLSSHEGGVFLYYLRWDGLWLKVGDLVSLEGGVAPFFITKLFKDGDIVKANLNYVCDNSVHSDYAVTCNVNYITNYSGAKVNLKGARERVELVAGEEFSKLMSSGVSDEFRVSLRRMALGNNLRVGIQGGFSNLNCIRVNGGPSDTYLDNIIFGFSGLSSCRKFSLTSDGDFEFLDAVMGKGWDVKVDKGDGFYKFVCELQLKRSSDCCLTLAAKFSKSQNTFTSNYRQDCRQAVIEGRQQMSNVIL